MAASRFPILFVTSSRIGDAVLSSGLVKRLLDEVPDARFTIVAGPLAAPLFAETPALDALVSLAKRRLRLHWLDLWRRARPRRWGLIVDLRGSALSRFLRRRKRAIHHPGPTPIHKVVEAARLLGLEDDPPAPFLFTSDETEARAAALTAGPAPILAVAPGANWIGKAWPAERFAQVSRALLGDAGPLAGGRLMLVGGPADQGVAQAVKAGMPIARVIDLTGRVDLLTAFACLKRARLFIGNNSGAMHLAAAAGAPTLGLFGPSDERLYRPWDVSGAGRTATVRGGRSFESCKALDPRLDQAICHMLDLPASAVLAAAEALIARTTTSDEETAP